MREPRLITNLEGAILMEEALRKGLRGIGLGMFTSNNLGTLYAQRNRLRWPDNTGFYQETHKHSHIRRGFYDLL